MRLNDVVYYPYVDQVFLNGEPLLPEHAVIGADERRGIVWLYGKPAAVINGALVRQIKRGEVEIKLTQGREPWVDDRAWTTPLSDSEFPMWDEGYYALGGSRSYPTLQELRDALS